MTNLQTKIFQSTHRTTDLSTTTTTPQPFYGPFS